MNLPLAFSPLIGHIPHAVPVVIVWGIMLRFYLVHRKQSDGRADTPLAASGTDPATGSTNALTSDRPVARRVWAVDDDPQYAEASTDPHEVPALGRTPAGLL